MGFEEAFDKFMLDSFGLDLKKVMGETDEQHKARVYKAYEDLTPEQKHKLRAYLLN